MYVQIKRLGKKKPKTDKFEEWTSEVCNLPSMGCGNINRAKVIQACKDNASGEIQLIINKYKKNPSKCYVFGNSLFSADIDDNVAESLCKEVMKKTTKKNKGPNQTYDVHLNGKADCKTSSRGKSQEIGQICCAHPGKGFTILGISGKC